MTDHLVQSSSRFVKRQHSICLGSWIGRTNLWFGLCQGFSVNIRGSQTFAGIFRRDSWCSVHICFTRMFCWCILDFFFAKFVYIVFLIVALKVSTPLFSKVQVLFGSSTPGFNLVQVLVQNLLLQSLKSWLL